MTTTTHATLTPAARAFEVTRSSSARSAAQRLALLAAPTFGEVFTDHVARVSWTEAGGWSQRRVEPYAPIALAPAALVLHYGQEVFEGLKAFRHPDGSVWAFRPDRNAARFADSARRLALPPLPADDFVGSVQALVAVDEAWVPTGGDASLYLRPYMFASEPTLLVRPGRTVEYLVLASPAGSYFAAGTAPVSIWVARDLRRAAPGGTGAVKTMANYAASLASQNEAYAHGCEQVCFLDAATGTLVEELGGMNVAVVRADGTVLTPALSGTLLPGVTRDAVLTLLREEGHVAEERALPLAEVLDGIRSGEITETFACGTGAVVTPIGRLAGEGLDLSLGEGVGPVTAWVRGRLTDIQHGRAPDAHGWLVRLV